MSNCKQYEKFETGLINENEFHAHIKTCTECLNAYRQDSDLLNLASSLRQPFHSSGLWANIEVGLNKEKNKESKSINIWTLFSVQGKTLLRIAAVLIIGFGLSIFFLSRDGIPEKGILEAKTLEKINQAEQDYAEAINDLEKLAKVEMNDFDLNLQLLYRDKLETIENQILACREALEKNPANAHIRRYLFMALQDKKETLKEIINTHPQKEETAS